MRYLDLPASQGGTCSGKAPENSTIALLRDEDWWFSLADHIDSHPTGSNRPPFVPTLAGLLDALIDSLLDAPSDNAMLRIHLACQISYLYAYVSELKERVFAESLKLEHRQYHLDTLSGMRTGTLQFTDHQRQIRDALRQGSYEVTECSASRDNQALFTEREDARVLATFPPPSLQSAAGIDGR